MSLCWSPRYSFSYGARKGRKEGSEHRSSFSFLLSLLDGEREREPSLQERPLAPLYNKEPPRPTSKKKGEEGKKVEGGRATCPPFLLLSFSFCLASPSGKKYPVKRKRDPPPPPPLSPRWVYCYCCSAAAGRSVLPRGGSDRRRRREEGKKGYGKKEGEKNGCSP